MSYDNKPAGSNSGTGGETSVGVGKGKGMQMDIRAMDELPDDRVYLIPTRIPGETIEEWERRCTVLVTGPSGGPVAIGGGGGSYANPGSVTVGVGNGRGSSEGYRFNSQVMVHDPIPVPISKYAIFTRKTIPIPRNWTHYEDGLPWVVWLREKTDGQWSTKLLGTAQTWQAACLLANTHYLYGWPLGHRMKRSVDVFDARHPGVWRYNVQRDTG